jgi:hypothetical protein
MKGLRVSIAGSSTNGSTVYMGSSSVIEED